MKELKENCGIPRSTLLLMAVMAGLTVANVYYNQPLLEMMRHDLGASEVEANMITVVTQVGYALGLFCIIPMGDLFSRRRIVIVNMLVAAVSVLAIAFADSMAMVWVASLVVGGVSVVPQLFIPIAGQFSRPEHKSRNIGIVLSGLLTGILASRVLSGFVGSWLGWRYMFAIASLLMLASMVVTLKAMPDMKRNFSGTYASLMRSVAHLFATRPRVRFYSLRASFAFGSMLAIWSCLAFHVAREPFCAGSDMVGVLGICGIVGAMAAGGIGSLVPRLGVRRMSLLGSLLQIAAWAVAFAFGDTYAGLIAAIVVCDLGAQFQQLSNQSATLAELPEASNRANTIFMTLYFIGGSLGTLCAGCGWNTMEWTGVCVVGAAFAAVSLLITLCSRH